MPLLGMEFGVILRLLMLRKDTKGREIVLLVPLLHTLHITSNLNKALHFAATIRRYTNYKGGLLLQLQ